LPINENFKRASSFIKPSVDSRGYNSMSIEGRLEGLNVYSTCLQSKDVPASDYVRQVVEVARWSEEADCTGILVYTDNSIVDPWLVAQLILENTEFLAPLVAVQPVYMHPYSVGKMVASFGYLYRRRVALSMLAGGFKNDLLALNDTTPHDDRYVRTTEYTLIIRQLLEQQRPVNLDGKYYSISHLRMTPPLPKELIPEILMSGSSSAGMGAAIATGATAVVYPRPIQEELAETPPTSVRRGARIGIIARERSSEAWRVAHERFPEDRKGEIAHELAMKVSDSVWHRQLSETRTAPQSDSDPYWLGPFHTYKTFCPYFVGSYERTAAEVARYIASGYRTFILDIPASREELQHIRVVLHKALIFSERIPDRERAPTSAT
jgi:alkanesulfonate monooxygenase